MTGGALDLENELRRDRQLALTLSSAHQGACAVRGYGMSDDSARDVVRNVLYAVRIDADAKSVEVDLPYLYSDFDGRRSLLFSSARGVVAEGEDWKLYSWTSPLSQVMDAALGEAYDYETASTQLRFVPILIGRVETLLPVIRGARYENRTERVLVQDAGDISLPESRPVRRAEPPEPKVRETAKDVTGLQEIIFLADGGQRAAMHLPFKENVLIEGPPGSGKTSIGIMRIPCLIDRQWAEMGLEPSRDQPFHREQDMVILVRNRSMVDYLRHLVADLGIRGTPVHTLDDLCGDLAAQSGVLQAVPIPESDGLHRLKESGRYRPHLLSTLAEQARQAWLEADLSATVEIRAKRSSREWEEEHEFVDLHGPVEDEPSQVIIRCALWESGPGLELKGLVLHWIRSMARWAMDPANSAGLNLAQSLSRWHEKWAEEFGRAEFMERSWKVHQLRKKSGFRRRKERKIFSALTDFADRFQAKVFSFDRIREGALAGIRGNDADSGLDIQEEALGELQRQVDEGLFSSSDLVLAATIAVKCRMRAGAQSANTGATGFSPSTFTHILVDEAQDLPRGIVPLLHPLLRKPAGTITLVGDLRQQIDPGSSLSSWAELGDIPLRRAVFPVNYRQTKELGYFLSQLHRRLFSEEPLWQPNEVESGPEPRVRLLEDPAGLVPALVEEIMAWRQVMPRATVAVLCASSQHIDAGAIRSSLAPALQRSGVRLRFPGDRFGGDPLCDTDCAVFAAVEDVKGLEYDAVVLVEDGMPVTGNIDLPDSIASNIIYVAASRARTGLSILGAHRQELACWAARCREEGLG